MIQPLLTSGLLGIAQVDTARYSCVTGYMETNGPTCGRTQ